jgi:hypothetical protein
MLNRTNWQHAWIALLVQHAFVIGAGVSLWLFGQPVAAVSMLAAAAVGQVAAVSFFFGREHAQREYKIGDPSKLAGYEALDFRNWSKDALFDLLMPLAATSVATWLWAIPVLMPSVQP